MNEDRTPSTASVFTTFTILVVDKNDNAPQFNSSEYRVRITELAQVGFALPLFIQVEDKDEVRPGAKARDAKCQACRSPLLSLTCQVFLSKSTLRP